MNGFELGTLITSLGIMILYNIYLYRKVFYIHSNKVQLSLNIQMAERWIMKHKEKADAPSVTLAIQTLRNSILVAVFVGGGVLNLAVSTANEFNDYESKDGRMRARTCVLAASCICSFLCWVNVIRYCAHLGYLIGAFNYTPPPPKQPEVTTQSPAVGVDGGVVDPSNVAVQTESEKERKKRFVEDEDKQFLYAVLLARYLLASFSFGFRFLFMGIPFIFFPMGAVGLIVATIIMLIFMFLYDHGLLLGERLEKKYH